MPPVGDGRQQYLCGFRTVPLVPALLRPGLNGIPILSEVGILASLFETRSIQTRNLDKFSQFVRMTGLDLLPIREFAALRCLRDASLERTLHRITRQIIGAIE